MTTALFERRALLRRQMMEVLDGGALMRVREIKEGYEAKHHRRIPWASLRRILDGLVQAGKLRVDSVGRSGGPARVMAYGLAELSPSGVESGEGI
jgi:hypothetical protein